MDMMKEYPLKSGRIAGEKNPHRRNDAGFNVMVSTARPEASRIGVDIFRRGGNAVDAAVAVGFALGVCEPNASGLGGGGFMTIRSADTGRSICIDFREIAPLSAGPSMWPTNDKGEIIGDVQREGGTSVCVPGEVAGFLFALDKYGTLSRADVISPAIHLGREGFEVTEVLYADMVKNTPKLKRYEEDGNPFIGSFTVGDRITNVPLSDVLEAIARHGVDGFYSGKLAERLVSSINLHAGSFQVEDLRNYRSRELDPVRGTYRDFEIISAPPPSSGGTHLIHVLNILENFSISEMAVNSVDYIHIFTEATKLSMADRRRYMGDPDFVRVPVRGIASKAYAKELASKIEMQRAGSFRSDNPFRFESADTTHFSVADSAGNMVSVTKTISDFFGSGVVPKNTGIVLNCQMRGFAAGDGGPNSVGPGKKPLSSMSPTIILREGNPFAVLGTPGGGRIIPSLVQVISRIIDHRLPLEEAICSPRTAIEIDTPLLYENRIGPGTLAALKARGHEIKELSPYDRKVGGVQGIVYEADGRITGVADPRRDGMAMGY